MAAQNGIPNITGAGIITSPATYTPAKIDPNEIKKVSPVDVKTSLVDKTAQAQQERAVLDEQKGTVQNQISGIIDKNSPLMQRAQSLAMQKAAGRGLINSSMAVGAAQAAVLDAATPIAQQDAAATNDFAKLNATEANKIGVFNAGETNTTARQNATETNRVNAFNAGEANTASRDEAAALNNTLAKNVDAENSAAQLNVKSRTETANSINSMMTSAQDELTKKITAIEVDTTLSADKKAEYKKNAAEGYLRVKNSTEALIATLGSSAMLLDFSATSGEALGLISSAPNVADTQVPSYVSPNNAVPAGILKTGSVATAKTPGFSSIPQAGIDAYNDPSVPTTNKYMAMYPDVKKGWASGDAASHWNMYGKNEGRIWPGSIDKNGNAVA